MKFKNALLLMPFIVVAVPHSAFSQTVPADLMDLSIEDLFTANVVSEEEQQKNKKRWHVSYTYHSATQGFLQALRNQIEC